MSNLSRRSLVASAAALPALALPAVAVASEPDPIFAALKAYEAALEGEDAGYEARANADDAFEERNGNVYPCGFAKGEAEKYTLGRFWPNCHSDINENRKLSKAQKAELHRELNRQEDDYEANVCPVHDAADAAYEKRADAQAAVFATVPTTLAGFKAKIDFAMSTSHVTECLTETETTEPLREFLDALYRSACLKLV